MKRHLTVIAALLSAVCAMAQKTPVEFKADYDRQVAAVGTSGLGVKGILEEWNAAWPDDTTMLECCFAYFLSKGREVVIEPRSGKKYLGKAPAFTFKDTTDTDIFFYEIPVYDETLFARSQECITRAIKLAPDNLGYRFDEVAALLDYERESPDMAAAALIETIEYNYSAKPSWNANGGILSQEDFRLGIMEYCYMFFQLGTPSGYENFKRISETMLRYAPKDTGFIDNIGAYWQIYKKDYKKATKFYKKALKINPEDYPAITNLRIISKITKK